MRTGLGADRPRKGPGWGQEQRQEPNNTKNYMSKTCDFPLQKQHFSSFGSSQESFEGFQETPKELQNLEDLDPK
jgi:hypothetical protein